MSTHSAPSTAYRDDQPDDYKSLNMKELCGWVEFWMMLGRPRVPERRMQAYLHVWHAAQQGASPGEAARRVNLTSARVSGWGAQDPLFRKVLQNIQSTVYLRLYERAFRADMETVLELWLELPTVPALLMAAGITDATLKHWRCKYPWFRQAFERIKRHKVATHLTNWNNWYDPVAKRWKRVRPLPQRD